MNRSIKQRSEGGNRINDRRKRVDQRRDQMIWGMKIERFGDWKCGRSRDFDGFELRLV